MQKIISSTVIQRSPKILSTAIDDKTVLMNVNDGAYYSANEVGQKIWEFIEKPTSFEDLCQKFSADFYIREDQNYQADLISFLQALFEKNLIEITNQANC